MQTVSPVSGGHAALRRLWWLIPFAVWSLPPLLLLLDALHAARVEARPIDWRPILPYAASCYLWAALTPLILLMGRRFGLSRPNRPIAIAAHAAAILIATLLLAVVNSAVRLLVLPGSQGTFASWVAQQARGGWVVAAGVYLASLLISYTKTLTRKYRERDLEAARLSAQLAQAQLSALRMQLNPHFLFNSLNAIAGLVREHDNRTAVRVLALLSDLLRHALSTTDVDEVPLREEMEFIRHYLEIERVRFPERLHVEWDVPDDVLDALVPSLLLQPVVENALRHGIHQRSARGTLGIQAVHRDGVLRLVVRDDGPGFGHAAPVVGGGVGLSNTRARLDQLYGDRGRLSLVNPPAGGAMVTMELPFHVVIRSPYEMSMRAGARHV